MRCYYNEIDEAKAAWLRELIKAKAIAPGDVDERSIVDVRADDLRGYKQCHFFAGIGTWSYSLRLARWPDDRPVWTGSCPCPSFSAAGKGEGFRDARHLWPDWFRLIRECCPAVVFGEQVEAAIGHGWLDLVQTDMESAAYAVGSAVLTAAGVGAPHIRARLYFVAHAKHVKHAGHDTARWSEAQPHSDQSQERLSDGDCAAGERSHALSAGLEGHDGNERDGNRPGRLDAQQVRSVATASGATRGFWADCDWWYGRDGKWRPIGKGISPLVFANSGINGRSARTCWNVDDHSGESAQRSDGDREAAERSCDSGEGCESKNRQRPIEPGLQPLAHGTAARIRFVCSNCKGETLIDEELRYVQSGYNGDEGCKPPEVLFRRLLLPLIDTTTQDGCEWQNPSQQSVFANRMQPLWVNRASGTPSPRSEREEQRPGKYRGTLLCVSPDGAQEGTLVLALRDLWQGVYSRITSQPKQDLFCGMCERMGPHWGRKEMASRVTKLRGYGDSLVAPLAKAFVEAYLEIEEAGR